jgi:hypothetical protein
LEDATRLPRSLVQKLMFSEPNLDTPLGAAVQRDLVLPNEAQVLAIREERKRSVPPPERYIVDAVAALTDTAAHRLHRLICGNEPSPALGPSWLR